jgi:hypothetical protein
MNEIIYTTAIVVMAIAVVIGTISVSFKKCL